MMDATGARAFVAAAKRRAVVAAMQRSKISHGVR
jgi:hypothetical protein